MEQKAQGAMGGSFNTREFFHGKTTTFLKSIKRIFLVFAFIVPATLLIISFWTSLYWIPFVAFMVQYLGLLAERWYFFAEAKHPQNLYYQSIA
jgi:DMSO reductase anchor subunit